MDRKMGQIPKQFFGFLWFFIKKQKLGFLIVTLASLVTSISATVWPYLISDLVDALNDYNGPLSEAIHVLKVPLISALVFWVSLEGLARVRGYVASRVMPRFQTQIRDEAFKYVSKHSHNYFVSNLVGGIANRISDLPRGAHLVVDVLITIFIPIIVSLVISCSIFSTLHIKLSLILGGWLGLHVVIIAILSRKASQLSQVQSEARTLVQGKIVDCISNHLNVRLFTRHEHEERRLMSYQEDERIKLQRALTFIEHMKLFLSVLGLFGMASLLFTTFSLWQQQIISIGSVVLVVNTVINVLAQMNVASEEVTYLLREIGICKQALQIFQDPIGVKDQPEAGELVVTAGTIRFEDVTFCYRSSEQVFSNQSFEIKGGQKIGLVGFSGSGKTTLVSLLLRLYEVESGRILIDEQDINFITARSLRENIAFIAQEPTLFHRSVIENIRYGNINATDEEIVEAAKKANCHDFILKLEEGYDTQVGERGIKLSGGQRQRIAIARAILKNAPIVVMDEATSALDVVTEKLVRESLNNLIKGKTTIIIAHKLATVLDVDRILVFDKGMIVEDGTHKELLQKGEHYAMMWNLQHDGLLPDDAKRKYNVKEE